jgi:tetratricopeptide (TPR) repeat protein
MREAITAYQRAIRLNPQNAMAYGGMAHALNKLSDQATVRRVPGTSPAVAAAQQGVDVDPTCGNCQGTLGLFLFYHDWEWAKAEWHLREAIRLAPQSTGIRPSYAMLLAATGRLEQALSEVEISLKHEPHHVGWRVMRSTLLYLQRRYPEAVAAADHALAVDNRERTAWEWRARALFQLGRGDEAIGALAHTAFSDQADALEAALRAGGSDRALQHLLDLTNTTRGRIEQSWRRGPWRALLKDHAGALDELERAYEYRNVNLLYIATDPVWDAVREHPRFRKVLAGMGLEDAR